MVDKKEEIPTEKVKVEVEAVRKYKDEPLVSFSIQNPFKWIFKQIKQILKKQSITLSIPPLIAIPVLIVVLGGAFQGFFNFGRIVEKKEIAALPTPTPRVVVKPTEVPKPVLVSKLGTIKATYQISEISEASTASGGAETIPSRYVLVEKYNKITFLIVPQTLSLSAYLNKRVLVTGLFDSTKNTLTIEKVQDIELMP